MKIVTIVGARPQFIKAAVVSRAFANVPDIEEALVHTGQHYDDEMSDVFFRELGIPKPARNLGIGSMAHGAQTGRMLEAVETILLEEKPDWTLVYGDTNSTLAGALAAAKLHLPVAHVEAGLRSFNRLMPEEINRVLTDHVSDVLFAPTTAAVANLLAEGIEERRISRCGDVMFDAAKVYGRAAEESSDALERLGLSQRGYILATVHRAENTDDRERLGALIAAFEKVGKEIPVVLPLHPRTRKALEDAKISTDESEAIHYTAPLGYLDMMQLERNARVIATDSGGVQKEAYFHGVPCVTLREETEWVELVEAGWNRLARPHSAESVARAIEACANEDAPGERGGFYGDGNAARKIADELLARSS